MTGSSPDDDTWLASLVERSPLLPERALQQHWRTIIPWLPKDLRYALAAALLEAERSRPG